MMSVAALGGRLRDGGMAQSATALSDRGSAMRDHVSDDESTQVVSRV